MLSIFLISPEFPCDHGHVREIVSIYYGTILTLPSQVVPPISGSFRLPVSQAVLASAIASTARNPLPLKMPTSRLLFIMAAAMCQEKQVLHSPF